jgi:hypothetical protein
MLNSRMQGGTQAASCNACTTPLRFRPMSYLTVLYLSPVHVGLLEPAFPHVLRGAGSTHSV